MRKKILTETTPILRKLMENRIGTAHPPIDNIKARRFIDALFDFLFIRGGLTSECTLSEKAGQLQEGLSALLQATGLNRQETDYQVRHFFKALPAIYDLLLADAGAILHGDPAAVSKAEVVMTYPGFYATALYRIAHQLYKQQVKLLPRLFSEYGHSKTGIDIHPGARIGEQFMIDHGTGIVVGETAVLGNRVSLFQGVTLGAIHVAKALVRTKRHPTVGDDVVIYAGATILGGETHIGNHSVIGGNVWLTRSVPPFSVVYQKSEVIIRDKNPLPEPINFVI